MNTITKRWLCMLVVVAMVLSMSPVITLPAAAAVTNPGADKIAEVKAWEAANAALFNSTEVVTTEKCPICGAENVVWTPRTNESYGSGWDFLMKGAASTHVYLAGDIEQTAVTGYFAENGSSQVACLYLNNKNITTNSVFYVRNTMNIFGAGTVKRVADSTSSMKERGMFTAHTSTDRIFNIYGGTYVNEHAYRMFDNFNSMTVNIYGGEFTSAAETYYLERTRDGGSGSLNIYGGTINGGIKMTRDNLGVNMYGGTIKGVTKDKAAGEGGAIYMTANTFNLYGGTIEGGKTVKNGGNVYINGGTFNMSGGEIKNGTVSGDGWPGGNVYMTGSSTFTMSGGKIYGGSADNRGGNICVDAGTLTMSGGEIYGGTAGGSSRHGGNVYFAGGVFTMSGGKIYNGTASGKGGNVYVYTDSTINMSGDAELYGGTASGNYPEIMVEGGVMTMAGNAKITAKENSQAVGIEYKTSGDGASLTMSDNASIVSANGGFALRLYKLTEDTLSFTDGWSGDCYLYIVETGYSVGGTLPAAVSYSGAFNGNLFFTSKDDGISNNPVKVVDGKLTVRRPGPSENELYSQYTDTAARVDAWVANNSGETFISEYCPVCNKEVTWTDLATATYQSDGMTGDSSAYGLFGSAGDHHFYLSKDLTLTDKGMLGRITNNTTVCLFVNKNLTTSGNIYNYGKMNAFGNGTYTYTGGKGRTMFSVNSSGAVYNFYSGTYTNTATPTTWDENTSKGTAPSSAMFAMFYSVPVNIYGGTFNTGNISFFRPWDAGGSTLNVYGGTINGGDAPVIDLTVKTGTVNISGGVINGGKLTASDGGAIIRMTQNATITISGGVLRNGQSKHYGGNIDMTNGTITMTGGEILGGTIYTGKWSGGNAYINGGTFNMEGGKIYNGKSDLRGGNIDIENGTLTITGGEIYGGAITVSGRPGGNIIAGYNSGAATVTMTGGKVYNGTATAEGGNIYVGPNSSLAMSGDAQVYDGTASGNGGNIYVTGTGVFSMTDNAAVTGGTAVSGGNIYMNTGSSMTMSGKAMVANGTKTASNVTSSHNITLNGATLTMSGDSVVLDKHNDTAGAIFAWLQDKDNTAKVTLSENASVYVTDDKIGEAVNNLIRIYASTTAKDKLYIEKDWDGIAYVEFGGTKTCGATIEDGRGNCDVAGFTGDLFVSGIKTTGVNGRLVLSAHDYKEEITKQPSCGEAGEKTYTCSNCGGSYTEEIAVLAHNYTSAVTREPTCALVGIRTYTCSACKGSYTEEIPVVGHTAGTPVMENMNVAGPGHYDLVTYCSVCKAELSRTSGVTDGSEKDLYAHYTNVTERVNAWVSANSSGTFSSNYCPHCNETVIWEGRSAQHLDVNSYGIIYSSTATHIYLTDDINVQTLSMNFLDGGSTHAVCLYLNGKNVTVNSGFYTRQTLSIMGNGTVTRKADTTSSGKTYGMFRAHGTGTNRAYNIYGGTYINEHSVRMFDNFNSMTVNIYGGEFTSAAGTYVLNASGDGGDGGLNIYGGTINGGIVMNRGNNGVNMYGGVINGVAGSDGGAIYMTANTFNMHGGTINGATVTGYGGAVYMAGGSFNMYDGIIQNGSAARGGNVSVCGGTFTMTGGTLVGGSSGTNGGNLYGLGKIVVNIGGTATIKEGKGTGNGDNIYVVRLNAEKRPTLNITGGTICDGETDNVQVNGGHISMTGGQIIAKGNPGDGQMGNALEVSRQIDVPASMILGGTAVITSRAETPHNVFRLIGYTGNGTVMDSLHIRGDWSGTAYLYLNDTVMGGDTLDPQCITFDSGFTGKLYILKLLVKEENGSLTIPGGAAVVTEKGSTWYETLEEAVAAYKKVSGSAYIEVRQDGVLDLGSGTYYVDANGRNVTVNLKGEKKNYWITQITYKSTLYMLDRANNGYERSGSWVINQGEYSEFFRDATNPINGYRYYTINEDNGTYSTHRIDIKLTAVTLRPSKAGLYYKASYTCDAELASRITMYGVALSATDMPGADFETASTDVYSYITSGFNPDENHTVAGTSCAVFGIMKEANTASKNKTQGEAAIYANPYIKVDVYNTADDTADDVNIMGDIENTGKQSGINYSLLDILMHIDNNWVGYSSHQQTVMSFYEKWNGLGVDWDSKFAHIDGDSSDMSVGIATDKLSWDKINSLPIANSNMTEDELRQLCIDFMELQLTFAWKPNQTTTFANSSSNIMTFYPGAVYGGLPYVTQSFGNLYKVMEYYDPETGVLDLSGGDATFKIIGNQCSSSTFWAWNRVCASLVYQGTSDAIYKNGCIPVGDYTYNKEMDSFSSENQLAICQRNGATVMYESYAQLKMADGLVDDGHMRMVYSINVVRNGSAIDGNKSTVTYLDQKTGWKESAQSDGSAYEIQGGLYVTITFADLYKDGYLPFTIAELNDPSLIQAQTTQLNLNGQTNVSANTLSNAIVSSNYAISNIEVVVKNAEGEEVYSNTALTYGLPREYAMRSTFDATEVAALGGNGTTIEVNVRIGNGELVTVYTGNLPG